MTRGSPVINRERDLAGATPEKLARVLLRNQLRPRPGYCQVACISPFRLRLHQIQFAEGFVFRSLGGFPDHVTEFRKLAVKAIQNRIIPLVIPG